MPQARSLYKKAAEFDTAQQHGEAAKCSQEAWNLIKHYQAEEITTEIAIKYRHGGQMAKTKALKSIGGVQVKQPPQAQEHEGVNDHDHGTDDKKTNEDNPKDDCEEKSQRSAEVDTRTAWAPCRTRRTSSARTATERAEKAKNVRRRGNESKPRSSEVKQAEKVHTV